MKTATSSIFRPSTIVFAIGLLLALAASNSSMESPAAKIGVADDWSHHRLIFSNPGTAEEAIKNGSYARWLGITNDSRYKLQQTKRDYAAKGGPSEKIEFPDEGAGDKNEIATPENLARFKDNRMPRGLSRAPLNLREHPRPERGRRRKTPNVHLDWSENMGSLATSGLGVFPAKYSFTTSNANCGNTASPDFVVYNTGLPGSASQASIIAYDNLYPGGCTTGNVPSVYWAYNTNAGTIVTSVTLSLDGSQVAFVQSVSGVANLVVLKWAESGSETAISPLTLAATAAGSYRACGAPCMTSIAFSGGANDSGSAPFVFYDADTLYVGDDSGKLHKFTGVFGGTPTEAGGAWPVTVSASALASPVYDGGSGNVFVGDYQLNGATTCSGLGNPCGFFYSFNGSTGAPVGKSNKIDFNSGIVDSPLVDSAAGMAYVFVGADGDTGAASPCGSGIQCSGVFQFPVSFTNGSGTEATVGPGFEFMLSGAFDNTYLASGTPGSPSGNLYVVGNTGGANNTLFQVSIGSNVMNKTSTVGPAVSDNFTNGFFAAGLQVTEFFNGTNDLIFLSVLSFGAPASCTSTLADGCVMGFDVTSGTITASTAPTAAATEAGGTSGIIIDNSSALAGASNIYFTPLASQLCTTSATTGGCAIQTLQAMP
ncbi:MAG: hypothetical protein WAM91_17745 [Candidatus Acidiferrales bacterium]